MLDWGDRIKDPERYEVISKFLYLFENGRCSRTAGTTLWSAYNAVNDYLNYSLRDRDHETEARPMCGA